MTGKYAKEVHEAIVWVATEEKYMTEIEDGLLLLKRELAGASQKKKLGDVQRVLRNLRWVGRSEERANKHEREVIRILSALDKDSSRKHHVQDLCERIKTEVASILKQASLYEGHLRDEITMLQEIIEKDDEHDAREKLETIFLIIKNAISWMNALIIDLEEAGRIVEGTKLEKSDESARKFSESSGKFKAELLERWNNIEWSKSSEKVGVAGAVAFAESQGYNVTAGAKGGLYTILWANNGEMVSRQEMIYLLPHLGKRAGLYLTEFFNIIPREEDAATKVEKFAVLKLKKNTTSGYLKNDKYIEQIRLVDFFEVVEKGKIL